MTIKDELVKFGATPEDAAIWAQQGASLLPVQEAAVKAGLFQRKSLFVSAVSSAGKTTIAEIAAVLAARQGRLAFFLVPLKAVAE